MRGGKLAVLAPASAPCDPTGEVPSHPALERLGHVRQLSLCARGSLFSRTDTHPTLQCECTSSLLLLLPHSLELTISAHTLAGLWYAARRGSTGLLSIVIRRLLIPTVLRTLWATSWASRDDGSATFRFDRTCTKKGSHPIESAIALRKGIHN